MKTVFKTVCVTILLCQIGSSTRVKPNKKDDEDCEIQEKKRTCSLQSIKGTWTGSKNYEYPKKFILLWPLPFGNYENVRRTCEACDLEVAEIWDEDDHDQMVDLIKNKYSMDVGDKYTQASFWLGAIAARNSSNDAYNDWIYQDGTTPVRFHHLRHPASWKKESISSDLSDKSRDCISIGPDAKDPTKIVWYVESCDSAANYGACQFKRKRHCYDESNSSPFIQINYTEKANAGSEPIVKPQPYYISSYPLTWELAKETCEEQNKTLLFFQNEDEQRHFRKIFLAYIADKPKYHHHEFWLTAKFYGEEQFDNLAWRIGDEMVEIEYWKEPGSGGIKKTWGIDPYTDNTEPYDTSGLHDENCVYAKFFHNKEQGTTWYTKDCEVTTKFFVCRDDNVEARDQSMVEYCGPYNNYVKREKQDCKTNLIFRKQKPECVCMKGLHGLTEHQSCNSRLLVGERCIKLNSKGVLHWKILNPEDAKADEWLIAQSRNRKGGRFIEWFSMKMNSSRQVFGNTNIYFAGLNVLLRGKSEYCFELGAIIDGRFFEFKLREHETAKITFTELCTGGKSLDNFKIHKVATPKMNECELKDCQRPPPEDMEESPFAAECGGGGASPDEDCEYRESQKKSDDATTTIRPDVTVSPEVGSKNIDVNQQMLMHAIDSSFMNDTSKVDINNIRPFSTWNILTRIFGIAKDVCECMVPKGFFDLILEMFKVAHYGQAYEYSDFFTRSEEREILNMLSECKATASAEKSLLCERNSCNNRVKKLNIVKGNVEIVDKLVDDSGYQGILHHHVMEAVWNVIDVWNVACIKEFKMSYLLYHHLEQGMEALFTEELRKLWHYPNVDENFYRRLLGPMESNYLMNLHHCVTGMYLTNPKVHRLSRPKSSPVNLLGKRIRNRRIKEYAIATGYEDADNDIMKFEEGNAQNKSSPVFCSRDQYCMKW